MYKKAISLLLCLGMLLTFAWAEDAGETEAPAAPQESVTERYHIPAEPLWRGKLAFTCSVYAEPDENAKPVGRILKGEYFWMYAVYPSWVYISYGSTRGFIRRSVIDHANVIDEKTTPPYGVEFYPYAAAVAGDTPVMSAPDENSETLITLHDGARVALLGFENGWAKLIFKRQYGYIDSRRIGTLIAVYNDAETAGTDRPIAAFVSFYKITTDEDNVGRMTNIAVACEKLSAITLKNGESLNFNTQIGPFNAANGYQKAIVLVSGGSGINYGGGTCQVSSTLYNSVLQLPGLTVTQRRPHGPAGASYLPHGVDAAVGSSSLNFRFRNDYAFPVRIDASSQDGALYIAIYKAEESAGE